MSARKTKRNLEIVKLIDDVGFSYEKVARLYGISKQRVAQVYHAEKRREQDSKTDETEVSL